MANASTAPADNTGNGRPAAAAPPVTINAQYVRDQSFENPNAPAIFMPQDNAAEPRVEIEVNIQTRALNRELHEVVLMLKATSKFGEKIGFIAELSYAGLFTIPPRPEKEMRNILLIDCPHQLFPFARAILSDMVRDGNFPPLLLAPIDFVAMASHNQEQPLQ